MTPSKRTLEGQPSRCEAPRTKARLPQPVGGPRTLETALHEAGPSDPRLEKEPLRSSKKKETKLVVEITNAVPSNQDNSDTEEDEETELKWYQQDGEPSLDDKLEEVCGILDPFRSYMVEKLRERLREDYQPDVYKQLTQLLQSALEERQSQGSSEVAAAAAGQPSNSSVRPPWKPVLQLTSKAKAMAKPPVGPCAAISKAMNSSTPESSGSSVKATSEAKASSNQTGCLLHATSKAKALGVPLHVPPPPKAPPAAETTPTAPAKPKAPERARGPGGAKHEAYYYQFFNSRRDYERMVRNQYRKRGGKNTIR